MVCLCVYCVRMAFQSRLDEFLTNQCKKEGIKKLTLEEAYIADHRGAICKIAIFNYRKFRFPDIFLRMMFPDENTNNKSLYYTVGKTDTAYLVNLIIYNIF